MKPEEIEAKTLEIRRTFDGAPPALLDALMPLMRRAAYEQLYLDGLDAIAARTGLVVSNPSNPAQQKALPVSQEIARHQASFTNIMDKLVRHLRPDEDEPDDGLGDYE
jgi:hypothetical protein